MKEVLQNELLQIISSSKEGIIKGIEFAQEQAPQLVSEILQYRLISTLVISIFCFIVFLGLLIWGITNIRSEDVDDNVYMPCFIFSTIPLFFVAFNLLFFLKAYFAPRMYLLEYLQSILV